MPNPVLEALTRGMAGTGTTPRTADPIQNGSQNQIAQAYKALQTAMNPMGALSGMFSQSQIGQVMTLVRQNGGDARQAFYNLAKQKGVDPNDILNQLR